MSMLDDDPSLSASEQPGPRPKLCLLLKQMWLSEKAAPEILPFKNDVVEAVKLAIAEQQARIDADVNPNASNDFLNKICLLEIDRLRFYLSSYLRTRLRKIERYALSILVDENQLVSRLSPAEVQFAEGYIDQVERHFKSAFLNQVPELFRSITDRNADTNMISKPDSRQFVFIRVKQDIGRFQIDEDTEMQLDAGDLVLTWYRPLRALIDSDGFEFA